MSLGLMITTGETNQPLSAAIMQYVVEARVEQELSKAFRFAIRFEEDICGGFLENSSQTRLQPGTIISILVPEGTVGVCCLVRGKIQKVKTSIVTGGTGSWYEIHGEDMRAEMARESFSATYEGKAHLVVTQMCERAGLRNIETQETLISYNQTLRLSQSGTNLAFIETAARTENYEFWVSYDRIDGASVTDSRPVDIHEMFHFKPSPPRAVPSSVLAPIAIPLLPAVGDSTLRVNASPEEDCINTLSFALDVNAERASSAYFTALDSSGQLVTSQTFSPQPAVDTTVPNPPQIPGIQYPIVAEARGTAEEQRLRAEAALIEQSWFITATCSTSMFLYQKVAYPHQIVKVEGMGAMHSGTYQINKVIHVVNSHGHLMDLTLRRNTFNMAATRSSAATPELLNAG